jgi:hypothetical protein
MPLRRLFESCCVNPIVGNSSMYFDCLGIEVLRKLEEADVAPGLWSMSAPALAVVDMMS